jgi:hypothetical protein
MSVYPTNSTFDRLQMPGQPHVIPPNPRVLGAYATPKANTLMPLFLLLFGLIFELLRRRSHVRTQSIGESNHAGQAKTVKYVSGIKCLVVQKILLI